MTVAISINTKYIANFILFEIKFLPIDKSIGKATIPLKIYKIIESLEPFVVCKSKEFTIKTYENPKIKKPPTIHLKTLKRSNREFFIRKL